MNSFDLLDAESGILASVSEGAAAVIFQREETLGPIPASDADAATDLEGGVGRLTIDKHVLAFGTEEPEASVAISGERIGTTEITLSKATGGLTTPEGESPLRCLALASRTTASADPDASLTKSITVAFADGGLFALRAARPRGAAEQEGEEVVAAFTGPDGDRAIEDALLSTTYDREGKPDRATLELWQPEGSEERAARGGGIVLRSATTEIDGCRIDIAFFRFSFDGRQGLGRYEIAREA